MTKPILEEISAEQELRELEEARKRYRYDVNTARSVGHREGKEEGIEIGKEIGRTEGERIKLVDLICKNHRKGKLPNDIADVLDVSIEMVNQVLESVNSLNSYDPEKIYEYLK